MAERVAGPCIQSALEAIEHCWNMRFDVPRIQKAVVEPVAAAFTAPRKTRHALQRVWHAQRQVDHIAGTDGDVTRAARFLDREHHLAFNLVEDFRTFGAVIAGAGSGSR